MSRPDTLVWLASHELRLGWRDWLSLMTAGRRTRARTVTIALIVFAAFMHALAYSMVGRYAEAIADKATLVVVTGCVLLSLSLLLSQAMESVTRAFYTRADLDLILSSPVSARKVFSVRIARIAISVALIAMLLAAPFINVLAVLGGMHWLAAFGVVGAMGAVAAALAVVLTITLFRTIGAKRTRLVAQIVAAMIGASFVIGLQVAAILSYGSLSRFSALQSEWLIAHAPDSDSALWFPARAVLGDPAALVVVGALGLALLGVTIAIFAGSFGEHATATTGVSNTRVSQKRWSESFRCRSARSVLRQKEWTLLARDPWLVSQSLMQILYLLPPALMLWLSFREGGIALVVLVPVLVMAAGQLAGGLAWLSISGEDAPDLVATAPILAARVTAAKIEAVIGTIALVFAPLAAVLAFASPLAAAASVVGVLIAAASATLIQLCFRVQARRVQFRRRQTSSRIATFAEAFSSIAWAATAALAAGGTWLALFPAFIAIVILAGVWLISPPNS